MAEIEVEDTGTNAEGGPLTEMPRRLMSPEPRFVSRADGGAAVAIEACGGLWVTGTHPAPARGASVYLKARSGLICHAAPREGRRLVERAADRGRHPESTAIPKAGESLLHPYTKKEKGNEREAKKPFSASRVTIIDDRTLLSTRSYLTYPTGFPRHGTWP
jgi:hypothetical protein